MSGRPSTGYHSKSPATKMSGRAENARVPALSLIKNRSIRTERILVIEVVVGINDRHGFRFVKVETLIACLLESDNLIPILSYLGSRRSQTQEKSPPPVFDTDSAY